MRSPSRHRLTPTREYVILHDDMMTQMTSSNSAAGYVSPYSLLFSVSLATVASITLTARRCVYSAAMSSPVCTVGYDRSSVGGEEDVPQIRHRRVACVFTHLTHQESSIRPFRRARHSLLASSAENVQSYCLEPAASACDTPFGCYTNHQVL